MGLDFINCLSLSFVPKGPTPTVTGLKLRELGLRFQSTFGNRRMPPPPKAAAHCLPPAQGPSPSRCDKAAPAATPTRSHIPLLPCTSSLVIKVPFPKVGVRAKSLCQTKPQSYAPTSVFSETKQVVQSGALSTSITRDSLNTSPLQKHRGPISLAALGSCGNSFCHLISAAQPAGYWLPEGDVLLLVWMDEDLQRWWGTK